MGNRNTRVVVDEKYTRPQGLHDSKDLDYRKLRRLILNGQLAPCFPGGDECTFELDECPICFLFYPSLNRSRCCSKAICTECYLQVKAEHLARSVQCPFCKTSSYTVEFRGAKTTEEKGVEQAEEQKVIEAKIRMQQRELRDEAERVKRLAEDTQAEPYECEGNYMSTEPSMPAQAAQRQGSLLGFYRTEQFDLDEEDVILMEALALSIQEQGTTHEEYDLAQHFPAVRAGLRGRDHITTRALESGKSLIANRNECGGLPIGSCMIEPFCRGANANGVFLPKEKQDVECENWQDAQQSWLNASHGSDEELNGWSDDSNTNSSWLSIQGVGRDFNLVYQRSSEAVEAGTSFYSGVMPAVPKLLEAPEGFRLSQTSDDGAGEESLLSASGLTLGSLTFEDQIMLAMALSLADAQIEGRETLVRNAHDL